MDTYINNYPFRLTPTDLLPAHRSVVLRITDAAYIQTRYQVSMNARVSVMYYTVNQLSHSVNAMLDAHIQTLCV